MLRCKANEQIEERRSAGRGSDLGARSYHRLSEFLGVSYA